MSPPSVVRRALSLARTRGSSVLAYHGIADLHPRDDPLKLMVPRGTLEAQVTALRRAGFEFVTVSELARRAGDRTPPPGLVALTFDDGCLNLLRPLLALAAREVPASVYVVTDWIGKRHPRMPESDEGLILGRTELRELADAGVEIGAHTATHPDLSTLSLLDCLVELRGSRETLESIIGRSVPTAAYPYGRHGPNARGAAQQAGFRVALSEEQGLGWDRLAMARAPVGPGTSWAAFALKAAGQYPRLVSAPPGRMVRSAYQRVRRTARHG